VERTRKPFFGSPEANPALMNPLTAKVQDVW
jgi:hypothetical protein